MNEQPHISSLDGRTVEPMTLVHPTDYSSESHGAFAHAVKIALCGHYALSLLNVDTGALTVRHSGVREVIKLLAHWKMLPPGAAGAESLERELGMSVRAVTIPGGDARAAVIDYLDNCRCDLAVIATRRHRGLSRWLERSLAERTQRRGATLALLMRENARGLVNLDTGVMKLNRILFAAEDRVELGPALSRLDAFLDLLGFPVEISHLHVGAGSDAVQLPNDGRKRELIVREGPVAEAILDVARRISADIIALPTGKSTGLIAALRGSVTANILDDGRWPVLSIPAR